MWYFFAGKLIALISYSSFNNLLIHFYDLNLLNKIVGWFFIEHVFEEYNKTSGKFFLINKDFRNLLKNLLILNRNILFWSQFLTLTELLLTISLLSLIVYFSIYLICKNKIRGKSKEVLILLYYVFLIYLLLLKSVIFLNWFDVCFMFKSIIIFSFICSISIFIYLKIITLYNLTLYNLKFKKTQIFFIKSFFYLLTIGLLNYSCTELWLTFNLCNNNIMQELFISILLPYTYVYIKFFILCSKIYKCLLLINYVKRQD